MRKNFCFGAGSTALPREAFSSVLPLALFLAMVPLTGCKSVSQCISPRIEGRVIDAHTRQPIKDVLVARYNANEELKLKTPPKAGQLMERAKGLRTDATGSFKLDSIRDVAPFEHVTWYSVTLSFDHPAYTRLLATYTVADATNHVAGELSVSTGDILLVPKTP